MTAFKASDAKRKRQEYKHSKKEEEYKHSKKREQKQRRLTGGKDQRTEAPAAAGVAVAEAMSATFANDKAEVVGLSSYFKSNGGPRSSPRSAK